MLYNYIIFQGDPSYIFIFLQSKRPAEIGDFLLQNTEKPSHYTAARALTSDWYICEGIGLLHTPSQR